LRSTNLFANDLYVICWCKDRKTSPIFEKGSTRIEIGEEDYYEACIRKFNEFVDKYLIIYEMIGKRMAKERYTNSTQEEYRKHFYMYTQVRWEGDIKDLKLIVDLGYPRYTVSGGV